MVFHELPNEILHEIGDILMSNVLTGFREYDSRSYFGKEKAEDKIYNLSSLARLCRANHRFNAVFEPYLYKCGARMESQPLYGLFRPQKPAMWATILNQPTTLKKVLIHGLDPNIPVEFGSHSRSSLLHRATIPNPNLEIMKVLLDHGADVRFQDDHHRTPLHAIVDSQYNHMRNVEKTEAGIKILLEYGANINARRRQVGTALNAAVFCVDGNVMARILLRNGADVNAVGLTPDQRTPLHEAVARSYWDTVPVLIEYGADIMVIDGQGKTVYDVLVENERFDKFSEILDDLDL
ncbi:Similar to Ankyrin repeat and SOCS box protein 8; acc. no. Q08E43 [Pyronema omphalodes CBS 100304]|uniref:Similar to Ankyrin repeat and SOCS box protein 8 acc. no. Q08E43 n=1 Tax=Pyronema omphalodes (strain CBS 100304) TaxID=1076935 RepID=U4LCX8_PYROM|nr:Similar to Ankyrin repeat and SOCS box protein 8; acc. no. Q08E43 [Pyronema omphalodes CBS 100304]